MVLNGSNVGKETMTPHSDDPIHADTVPEPQIKNTAIPPAEIDPPEEIAPLDDMPVAPLTEPSDTSGG
jgi:hypothetical protein